MVGKVGLPPLVLEENSGTESSGSKPAFLILRLSNSNSKTFLES